jgi:aspartate-semialdehyde dehydrogenase
LNATGKRDTFVGRIRADEENPGAYHMWVVSDNLLKGAAWNAVQIGEELVKRDLIHVPTGSAALFQ